GVDDGESQLVHLERRQAQVTELTRDAYAVARDAPARGAPRPPAVHQTLALLLRQLDRRQMLLHPSHRLARTGQAFLRRLLIAVFLGVRAPAGRGLVLPQQVAQRANLVQHVIAARERVQHAPLAALD